MYMLCLGKFADQLAGMGSITGAFLAQSCRMLTLLIAWAPADIVQSSGLSGLSTHHGQRFWQAGVGLWAAHASYISTSSVLCCGIGQRCAQILLHPWGC